jgi:hypothetical protein
MNELTKFPIRPVLKAMSIGETVEFPCGRNVETHRPFGDRRGSIRSAAKDLKKSDGLCFTVRAEYNFTRVTRLNDDPSFDGLKAWIAKTTARGNQ